MWPAGISSVIVPLKRNAEPCNLGRNNFMDSCVQEANFAEEDLESWQTPD